jgi:hypothetical protein
MARLDVLPEKISQSIARHAALTPQAVQAGKVSGATEQCP